jgi:hypothetical protein
MGTTLAVEGTYDAFMEENYSLALFRGLFFVTAAKSILAGRVQGCSGCSVYRSVDPSTGKVNYVGITKDLARRAGEHLRQKSIVIKEILGLSNLTREEARGVEQVLINYYGLGPPKGKGQLINLINSISTSNPKHGQLMKRGLQLLQAAGYPFDG